MKDRRTLLSLGVPSANRGIKHGLKHKFAALPIVAPAAALSVCPATCQRAGKPKDRTDEHRHQYGDRIERRRLTCTTTGYRYRECACGEKQGETLPALEHTTEEWEAVALYDPAVNASMLTETYLDTNGGRE